MRFMPIDATLDLQCITVQHGISHPKLEIVIVWGSLYAIT